MDRSVVARLSARWTSATPAPRARRAAAALPLLAALALVAALAGTGCSATSATGMTTVLAPGDRLDVVALGEHARVRVVNDGPGSVSIVAAGEAPGGSPSSSPAKVVDARGAAAIVADGVSDGIRTSVVNASADRASVHVTVQGSNAVDLRTHRPGGSER